MAVRNDWYTAETEKSGGHELHRPAARHNTNSNVNNDDDDDDDAVAVDYDDYDGGGSGCTLNNVNLFLFLYYCDNKCHFECWLQVRCST